MASKRTKTPKRTATHRHAAARQSRKGGKGKQQSPKTLEERLAKYQFDAAGYEFIPALMHEIRRLLSTGKPANPADEHFLAAMRNIKGGTEFLKTALARHDKLPYALKQRVFSPRYLNLAPDYDIGEQELSAILDRGTKASGRNVFAATRVYARKPESHGGCCCCCDDDNPNGDTPPQPRPNPYELSFARLYCVDESDPESWGSDEPYVVFAVITEAMAESGTAAVGFHTPVYEDVDDGDTRPSSGDENLRLFGFAGARPIDSNVLVSATCFEHDGGDISETTDKVRAALTAVATKAAAAGGVAGWIVAAAAVVAIGVSYLVDLFAADDQIGGTRQLTLNQAQADASTNGSNPFFFPALRFDGGDDDGIYDVYLKLRRA